MILVALRDQPSSGVSRTLPPICVTVGRLPRVRQSLEDLAGIRAYRWPDTDWAVRLSTARDEAERRLLDLSSSMSSAVRGEAAV